MSTIRRTLDLLKSLLPTAIIILKFTEWWTTSNFAHRLSLKQSTSIDLPAPNLLKPSIWNDSQQPEASNICPICHEEIKEPAALETGIVGDYTCFYRYIEEEDATNERPEVNVETEAKKLYRKCPVTGGSLLLGTIGIRRLRL